MGGLSKVERDVVLFRTGNEVTVDISGRFYKFELGTFHLQSIVFFVLFRQQSEPPVI